MNILGKNYRFDSNEVNNFKKLTGIDFSCVKLYAIPERFVKKLAKVKTMRSMDEAVTKGFDNYEKTIAPKEYVINKYRNRGATHNIFASIGSNGREVYNAIKGTISDDTVFAKVIKMKEVLSNLETATDMCEDAANVIETIIVKYA